MRGEYVYRVPAARQRCARDGHRQSACPAGTTGKFALVARVRDEAGASTPIEFTEMWQSPDAQDYIFFADYPIGDNVFLESVRVRNLSCTCQDPAQ